MDDDDGMSVGTDQSMRTAPSQASLHSADEEMPEVRDVRLERDETVRGIVSELDNMMSSLPTTPAASEAGNNRNMTRDAMTSAAPAATTVDTTPFVAHQNGYGMFPVGQTPGSYIPMQPSAPPPTFVPYSGPYPGLAPPTPMLDPQFLQMQAQMQAQMMGQMQAQMAAQMAVASDYAQTYQKVKLFPVY